jgi:Coenzyme PQQ synthesis protein D (PqqD)
LVIEPPHPKEEGWTGVRAGFVETVNVAGTSIVTSLAGALHVLNPTATLLWQCIDGVSTIEEICTDLADVLAVPYERVLADASAVIDDFRAKGLLLDASAPPAEPDPVPESGAIFEPPNL